FFFFFSSRRRHTRWPRDWSSDVCSSDLDGSQTRDFVYVANVVHANLLAAHAPAARVAGQVFNVGSGHSVSVNELWDRVRALTGEIGRASCRERGEVWVGVVA